MKALLILFASTLLLSCDTTYTQYTTVCSCEQRKQVAKFVDERTTLIDFEQVKVQLKEAEEAAIRIYCNKKNIDYRIDNAGLGRNVLTKLDSCEVIYW